MYIYKRKSKKELIENLQDYQERLRNSVARLSWLVETVKGYRGPLNKRLVTFFHSHRKQEKQNPANMVVSVVSLEKMGEKYNLNIVALDLEKNGDCMREVLYGFSSLDGLIDQINRRIESKNTDDDEVKQTIDQMDRVLALYDKAEECLTELDNLPPTIKQDLPILKKL